jgi:hypothetical protein
MASPLIKINSYEELEDITKGVIKIRKSKKHRKYNVQ